MAKRTPSSNEMASPESVASRKKRKANPPDFSDPNALVTFIIIEKEEEEESNSDDESESAHDGEREDEGEQKGEDGKLIETKFTVHKEIACYHSPILNTALNSKPRNGQTQIYRLEDTTSRAFKLFVQWLYFEKFREAQFNEHTPNDNEEQPALDSALIEVWVLAEKLSVPLLQNAALSKLDQLSRKHNTVPTYCLRYINAGTTMESPLRKYFIDVIGSQLEIERLEDLIGFPKEILCDLVIYYAKDRKEKVVNLSDYLVRENGKDNDS